MLRGKRSPSSIELSLLLLLSMLTLHLHYAHAMVRFLQSPEHYMNYAQPVLILVVLVNILFSDVEFSFVYLCFISLLTSLKCEQSTDVFLLYFVSGFVAIILSSNIRRRVDFTKAGVASGLVLGLMIMIIERNDLGVIWDDALINGLANGIVSAVVVTGVSGLFEYLFGQVTNITLLELSDFNHPLMRKLVLEAPGTYQHSLMVANLAEAAAEEVGANALLARVGAYYHDIGKMSKAEYFSENQMLATYRDKHKKLTPAMSTLIIMNHIKEGIELARKYHINKRIREFIQQHHGTTLVYYFFAKAKQQKTDDEPEEEEFMYPGPKPQTKEVAIVHLADTVEARIRSLDEPTPSRIQELVKESVTKRLLEGQLDECDLTFKDLDKICAIFTQRICAMFHARVDYRKADGKKEDADRDNEQTEEQTGQSDAA
jgi:putative nucleotidyltransferase with HDIG domain